MRVQASGVAERTPRRLGRSGPALVSRRGESAAALATAVLVAELVLAQLTLALTVCLVVTGRLARWRAHWLAVPAAAGLAWVQAIGPAHATSGFAAWPRWLAAAPARLASRQPAVAAAAVARQHAHASPAAGLVTALVHRLPGQLPIALAVAAGQAAFVLWLGWRHQGAARPVQWRPGLIALARRRRNAVTLAAGHRVTRDGWAFGLEPHTGRLAGLSWAEAAGGVLLTGQDGHKLSQLALTAASAAITRRKTLLIVDLAGCAAEVSELAGPPGVPVSTITVPADAGQHDDVAAAVGLAIRRRAVLLVSSRHHPGEDASFRQAAGLVVAGLVAVLHDMRDLRLRGDSLVWVSGCEHVSQSLLAGLIELGQDTGTAVVLSTTNAAGLGQLAGIVVEARADGLVSITGRARSRPLTNCRLVP